MAFAQRRCWLYFGCNLDESNWKTDLSSWSCWHHFLKKDGLPGEHVQVVELSLLFGQATQACSYSHVRGTYSFHECLPCAGQFSPGVSVLTASTQPDLEFMYV